MDYKIILVYCLCADLLKAFDHKEDVQCTMSDAEVMTAGLVAALFFGGKHTLACEFLQGECYRNQKGAKNRKVTEDMRR